ncbi:MAG: diacylglycerol kinase [Patescibacteria group bacterium]|nr:diacylglycerol kinase [Patescibacteria group bacterium]
MIKLMKLKKSFFYALKGITYTFRREQNFRIEVIIAVLVIAFMFFLGLRNSEKIVVLLLVTFILTLEMFNTIIERFLDLLKPRLDSQVKLLKDIMAGVVFLASVGSLVIGCMIFYPYIVELISK